MTENRIDELKRISQKKYKKKKNQIVYGIIFSFMALMIYIIFLKNNFIYSSIWIIGLFIGFTLQRARFCFAASFRDPIMVGSTSIIKSIIIAFIISTIGFGLIQYSYLNNAEFNFNIDNIPGQIQPVGIHTAIGAILFGTGMVIAGGCASGTLMRIGEGFQLQLIVLIGFLIGTGFGAKHFEFWDKMIISKASIIYFPQYIGLPLTMIIQIIILIILYFLADWYDKNNSLMSM